MSTKPLISLQLQKIWDRESQFACIQSIHAGNFDSSEPGRAQSWALLSFTVSEQEVNMASTISHATTAVQGSWRSKIRLGTRWIPIHIQEQLYSHPWALVEKNKHANKGLSSSSHHTIIAIDRAVKGYSWLLFYQCTLKRVSDQVSSAPTTVFNSPMKIRVMIMGEMHLQTLTIH